jgi:hypothetical protein
MNMRVATRNFFILYRIDWWGDGLKGIVSPDWKGLQMISLDRFEV